jgi:hypothetical protein
LHRKITRFIDFLTLTNEVMHPEAVQKEQVAEDLTGVKVQGQPYVFTVTEENSI